LEPAEQYNTEIDEAMKAMEDGDIYTHEQVKNMSKDWLNAADSIQNAEKVRIDILENIEALMFYPERYPLDNIKERMMAFSVRSNFTGCAWK
jgi:hypothetical protein